MKKLFILITLLIASYTLSAQAVKYPFAAATVKSVALTADTALVIAPVNTLEIISAVADTNIVVHFTNTRVATGSEVYLKINATNVSNRTITFQTGIKGNTVTMTKNKNYVFKALFDGTQYLVISSLLTD